MVRKRNFLNETDLLRKRLERLSVMAENRQKTLIRINKLIKATTREPFEGVGKPESLKHSLAGYWSRRINEEHRMVYKVTDDALLIAQLRYHY